MSKSHVAMEKNICLVTGKEYETGSLLLATRYNKGEPTVDLEGENIRTGLGNNVTGNGFCPEVQEKLDAGYVALVCIDSEKSRSGPFPDANIIHPRDAYRTGEVIYMKRETASKFFNVEMENMAFIDEKVTKIIKDQAHPDDVK